MTGAWPRPVLPPRSAAAAVAAGAALCRALPTGARVGESAVASLRVHVLSAADPDGVLVLADRDAGQVFYGRQAAGQIVHVDVFHAPGALAPPRVVAAFARALDAYREASGTGASLSADWFDVQTAAGGGRLGGMLRGGRKGSVCAAHRGHVHLAGRLPPADTGLLFFLVASVEAALAGAGLPPRRLERVAAAPAGLGALAPGSLSDYETLTDTWLRESAGAETGGTPTPPRAAQGTGAGASAAPAPAPWALAPGWCGAAQEQRLFAVAVRLAEACGGGAPLAAALEALVSGGVPVGSDHAAAPSAPPPVAADLLAHLRQAGCVERTAAVLRLTGLGLALRRLCAHRLREIEQALRAAARGVAGGAAGAVWPGRPAGAGGSHRACGAVAPERGDRLRDLAAPETAAAAAARVAREGGSRLRVRPADVRVRRRVRPRRVDLCLLLDASASMEGGRMRAAKVLAAHLLLTGRGRVAVMTFQERGCSLPVPMTRRYAAAERGLRRISPGGLTPLAAGLRDAREYLSRCGGQRALLLLVTDGIPTASAGGGSPLEEALQEAERLRTARQPLCCIGLEPNEHYLSELVARAGGRLHVVAELQPDLLARLARRERARLEAGGRRWPGR